MLCEKVTVTSLTCVHTLTSKYTNNQVVGCALVCGTTEETTY